MPPASTPKQPEPFMPRIKLNLRDDTIPAGYINSAQQVDNSTNNEDKDEDEDEGEGRAMYEDNGIQELEKYI